MICRDQGGHRLFSSKTQCLSTETTEVSPFAIHRQSNLIARRDKYGHLPPLVKTQCLSTEAIRVCTLLSRDNWVWWHAETVMVARFHCSDTIKIPHHPKTSESDSMRRPSCLSIFIDIKAPRLLLMHLTSFMLFLLTGFSDWANRRSGGNLAWTKLVSYLYSHFISNKR